jgi:hypothetical protein
LAAGTAERHRRRASILRERHLRVIRLWLLAIGVAFMGAAASHAQTPDYRGIPDGFDYPADKPAFERERKAGNMTALRRHGWMLFAGMNQMTPDGEPNWRTWYRADEAFAPAGSPLASERRMTLQFTKPNQRKDAGPGPDAPRDSALSFVLFNWENFDHIRAKKLFLKSDLDRINRPYRAATPWDKRIIPPFPDRAVSLKTLWWPAAGDGKTALPVWDNEPTQPLDDNNPFRTWKRVVAVDGTRQAAADGETADINFYDAAFPASRVVGLNRFYNVRVDEAMLAAIDANQDDGVRILIRKILGRELKIGDYILFLGFHVTTKEIDDWTWQTFWWHDRPSEGIFAAERPDAVAGVWRNYLMSVVGDEVNPKEADGSPLIGFNPWLENTFRAGTQSNCMNCHHRASHPRIAFLPVRRGAPDTAADPAFKRGRLQTDFLWSIVDQAK